METDLYIVTLFQEVFGRQRNRDRVRKREHWGLVTRETFIARNKDGERERGKSDKTDLKRKRKRWEERETETKGDKTGNR